MLHVAEAWKGQPATGTLPSPSQEEVQGMLGLVAHAYNPNMTGRNRKTTSCAQGITKFYSSKLACLHRDPFSKIYLYGDWGDGSADKALATEV